MLLEPRTPLTSEYHVGWICAIQTEYVVAQELLDEEYNPPELPSHDENVYKFGRIGPHNVVVACLPKGVYGMASAAGVAVNMLRSFTELDIRLMVGIGGGAPSFRHDVRLGDVVVSVPTAHASGLIHYNYGRSVQDKRLVQTSYIEGPPQKLLAAIQNLATTHERKGHSIRETISAMINKNRRLRKRYTDPGPAKDVLFKSDFEHLSSADGSCDACVLVPDAVVQRVERDMEEDVPVVHYGLIASANQLMKDASTRDQLAKDERVLCFEMEAAGLSRNFPCLVIRGICDYSDSHKNDFWQGYAAATAAAYAKELLQFVPPVIDSSNSISSYQSLQPLRDSWTPVSKTPSSQSSYNELRDRWVGAQHTMEHGSISGTDVSSVTLQGGSNPVEGEKMTNNLVSSSSKEHTSEPVHTNRQDVSDANANAIAPSIQPALESGHQTSQALVVSTPVSKVENVSSNKHDDNQHNVWKHSQSDREQQARENRQKLYASLENRRSSAPSETQRSSENVRIAINENKAAAQKLQTENTSNLQATLSERPVQKEEELQKNSESTYQALHDQAASAEQKERRISMNTSKLVQQAPLNAQAQAQSNRQQLSKILIDKPTVDEKDKQKNAKNIRNLMSKKKSPTSPSPTSPPTPSSAAHHENTRSNIPTIVVDSPTSPPVRSPTNTPQIHDQASQSPKPLGPEVVVNNLPPETSDADLIELFRSVAGVKCHYVRKVFGQPNTRRATCGSRIMARSAISILTGYNFHNHTLELHLVPSTAAVNGTVATAQRNTTNSAVKPSKPDSQSPKAIAQNVSPQVLRKVIVQNLSRSMSDEELTKLFGEVAQVKCGTIRKMPKFHSVREVEFDNYVDARTAIAKLSGYYVHGRPLDLDFAGFSSFNRNDTGEVVVEEQAAGEDVLKPKATNPQHRVYVDNLPLSFDSDQLTAIFRYMGNVVYFQTGLFHGRPTAVVEYANADEAMKAADRLNNFNWGGSTLRVRYARPNGLKGSNEATIPNQTKPGQTTQAANATQPTPHKPKS